MNPTSASIPFRSKLVATGTCVLLASCASLVEDRRSLPLAEGQHVTRVSIDAYVKGKPRSKVTLTAPSDVAFVVNHLQDLEFRTYDHSSPEIDLTLYVSNGATVKRRVSEHEIGPGAPASAYNLHWFPKDDSLYRFLVAKAYPGAPR